jgi:hypothetical protein
MDLPKQIIRVLGSFEGAFSERVWEWAKVLLIGAILVPGERTVAAILRVMGQQDEKQFQNYHRVLNRAKWSSREVSHILLLLLVSLFMKAQDPIVMGIDETIERRRGEQIAARGIYRDPVRSSKKVVVKTSGLRWISLMLLTEVPWACRVWALPFLTVLAPSERYHEERKKRHKTITDWARQMVYQLHRWLPNRALVVVGDGTYAALRFRASVSRLPGVCVITPLRWDAALYDPAPQRTSHTKGRPALKGKRQPSLAQRLIDPKTVWQKLTVDWYGGITREVEVATSTAIWYRSGMPLVPIRWVLVRDPTGKFESRALLCTDQNADPAQIIGWFVEATGRLKSLFMRYVLILVWKLNGNGRIWLFSEPLPPFWDSFRLSPSLPINCWGSNLFPFARQLGILKPCPPFRTPWPIGPSTLMARFLSVVFATRYHRNPACILQAHHRYARFYWLKDAKSFKISLEMVLSSQYFCLEAILAAFIPFVLILFTDPKYG